MGGNGVRPFGKLGGSGRGVFRKVGQMGTEQEMGGKVLEDAAGQCAVYMAGPMLPAGFGSRPSPRLAWVSEEGYHAMGACVGTQFVEHTGSDVEELDRVGGDGVIVGQADWFVMSEAIKLDERDREVLRRRCHREAMGLDGEMLQGDDFPTQRIVIAAGGKSQAVDISMRCFQAGGGKIRFRALEAKSMYAAYEFERTLRQLVLSLPGIEQEAKRQARGLIEAGHAPGEHQVRQCEDLARSVRAIVDDVVRVLKDAERMEDEKVDRASTIIKRFNDAVGHRALGPNTFVVDASKGDTIAGKMAERNARKATAEGGEKAGA